MRCKICDTTLSDPKWNKQLNDWEICGTCLEIAMSAFEDKPDDDNEVEEDLLPEDLEEAYEIFQRENSA